MSNWSLPDNIDLDQAAAVASGLHDAVLFGEKQDGIDAEPIAAALVLQALGALNQAQGLFKQASLVRARERAENLKDPTP